MRTFPSGVLAAAVLAAEGVSSLLVGSAALWLRGEVIDVGDADVVIEPGGGNLGRLRDALAGIATGPVPSAGRLAGGSVMRVMTAYGTVDCLLERGRQDWARLRCGAGLVPVADVPVLVAARADAWDLRRRHKDRRR
jgi:hypothetical protein